MAQPDVRIFKPVEGIDRPVCINCKIQMWLLKIEPVQLGFELCTYECARCAANQIFMVRTADDSDNDLGGGMVSKDEDEIVQREKAEASSKMREILEETMRIFGNTKMTKEKAMGELIARAQQGDKRVTEMLAEFNKAALVAGTDD